MGSLKYMTAGRGPHDVHPRPTEFYTTYTTSPFSPGRLLPLPIISTMSLSLLGRLSLPLRNRRTVNPANASRAALRWSSSISQRPGSDRCVSIQEQKNISANLCSVRFPGAVNSKFTTEMKFINPDNSSNIPTFRVIDSDGVLVDKSRPKPKVSNEEILTWYKNMLTSTWSLIRLIRLVNSPSKHYGHDHVRGPATRPIEFLHGMCPVRNV